MHINMKYYVVSIGAIFLALGVGIIVGFNLNNNAELSKQQSELIEQLDSEYGTLKEDRKSLEKENADLEKKYSDLIDYVNKNDVNLVASSLSGKNIAMVSTYGSNDAFGNIKDTLKNNSGNIAFELVFNKEATDEEIIKEAAKKTGEDLKTAEDVSVYVFESIKAGKAEEKLAPLEELKMIDFSSENGDYSSYTSTVISAGSESEDPAKRYRELDKFVVSNLKKQGKYVVEAELAGAKTSYSKEYASEKVATVDNANENTGIYTLTKLLSGETTVGSFGRLNTAASLIPFSE